MNFRFLLLFLLLKNIVSNFHLRTNISAKKIEVYFILCKWNFFGIRIKIQICLKILLKILYKTKKCVNLIKLSNLIFPVCLVDKISILNTKNLFFFGQIQLEGCNLLVWSKETFLLVLQCFIKESFLKEYYNVAL